MLFSLLGCTKNGWDWSVFRNIGWWCVQVLLWWRMEEVFFRQNCCYCQPNYKKDSVQGSRYSWLIPYCCSLDNNAWPLISTRLTSAYLMRLLLFLDFYCDKCSFENYLVMKECARMHSNEITTINFSHHFWWYIDVHVESWMTLLHCSLA